MKAYSTDLRRKILEALDRGMPKNEAARAFGVSRSSVKRHAAARREGKPLSPKKHPGSKPKLDERARKLLEADVEERPTITSELIWPRFITASSSIHLHVVIVCIVVRIIGVSCEGIVLPAEQDTSARV